MLFKIKKKNVIKFLYIGFINFSFTISLLQVVRKIDFQWLFDTFILTHNIYIFKGFQLAQYLRRLPKDIEMMQPLPPRAHKRKNFGWNGHMRLLSHWHVRPTGYILHPTLPTLHPTHTQFFLKKEKLAIILPFLDF